MAELLEVNIICYTLEDNKYNLQAVYFCNKLNLENVIPLQFINNNHFNILYPQQYNFNISKKAMDITKLESKKIEINSDNKDIIPSYFNFKYVKYPRYKENKYNEIYTYLKYNILPENLNNIEKARRRQKNKNKFRKHVKDKYKLINNRLYYNLSIFLKKDEKREKEEKISDKIEDESEINNNKKNLVSIWKKIPYENEVIPICENIHELTKHGHLKLCQDLLFKSDYYWEGYSKTMKEVIKNC